MTQQAAIDLYRQRLQELRGQYAIVLDAHEKTLRRPRDRIASDVALPSQIYIYDEMCEDVIDAAHAAYIELGMTYNHPTRADPATRNVLQMEFLLLMKLFQRAKYNIRIKVDQFTPQTVVDRNQLTVVINHARRQYEAARRLSDEMEIEPFLLRY